MFISRRNFIVSTAATVSAASPLMAALDRIDPSCKQQIIPQPTYAIIPVVGDGKWIWTEPPEGQTGYLEPRKYDVSMGIRWTGRGNATNLAASTAVPCEHPEQKIDDSSVTPNGCVAEIKQLTTDAAQLVAAAPGIVKDQVIEAVAKFTMTLCKDYRGFEKDQFPSEQPSTNFLRQLYLGNSPGIQTTSSLVKKIVSNTVDESLHPWEKAKKFYQWVWENIKGKPGAYTSVTTAIKKKVGDCEERAGTFVALCRSANIPARLVWLPNHCWAEIGLFDAQEKFHWIPIHTAAYSWFGWTGAHELILQKGDSIPVYGKKRPERLISDWHQWKGVQPKVEFLASVHPVATETIPAGPGARVKQSDGQWKLTGTHPANEYMRNG
jgi:hypothetical protein